MTPDEQTQAWNGPSGNAWVEAQGILDAVLEPFADLLVAEARARPGARILDVGCGTGGTTVALAPHAASATGVDVSAPMIEAAERRGGDAAFVVADAETHPFDPASFDLVVSRFGIMFFADPVAAFANLRRATAEDGALRAIAWRPAEENPFMTAAERAARPLLPDLPPRDPDAPGQFAFGDPDKVERILTQAGWGDPRLVPIDPVCELPAEHLDLYITRLGPVGRALDDTPEPLRTEVVDTVREAFAPFVDGDRVRFAAACWMVAAQT